MSVHAIKQWNLFAGCSYGLSYFLQVLCRTRARAVCHFMTLWLWREAAGEDGVFLVGGCERGWLYEKLMLLFVTDVGRDEQWAAVWYPDIIYSAKKKKDINKMSFVTTGTLRINKPSVKLSHPLSPQPFNSCLVLGFFDIMTIISPY